MNILILYDSMLGSISAKVRGANLVPALRALGHTVQVQDVRRPFNFMHPDVVYLIKVANLEMIRGWCRGTKVVFDLNDALWREYHRMCGWQDLDEILATVHGVVCPNPYIEEYARQLNHRTTGVPDAPNVEAFDAVRDRYSKPEERRIGWVGSPGTTQGIGQMNVKDLRTLGRTSMYTEEEMIQETLTWHIGLYPVSIDPQDYIVRGALKVKVYMAAGAIPHAHMAGEVMDLLPRYCINDIAKQPWEYDAAAAEHNLRLLRQEFSLKAVAEQLAHALEVL